jgi:hypothetical protein
MKNLKSLRERNIRSDGEFGVSEDLVHHGDLAVQILGVVHDAQRIDP